MHGVEGCVCGSDSRNHTLFAKQTVLVGIAQAGAAQLCVEVQKAFLPARLAAWWVGAFACQAEVVVSNSVLADLFVRSQAVFGFLVSEANDVGLTGDDGNTISLCVR